MKKTFTALLMLMLASQCGLAADGPLDRATLVGMKGVGVLIEEFSSETPEGLTKSQLQTDVELKLRLAGLKVSDNNDTPVYLYVLVNSINAGSNYVYAISISVEQPVTVRATNRFYTGQTWSQSMVGYAAKSIAAQTVRSNVSDLMDKFLNAYLSVNPPGDRSK